MFGITTRWRMRKELERMRNLYVWKVNRNKRGCRADNLGNLVHTKLLNRWRVWFA